MATPSLNWTGVCTFSGELAMQTPSRFTVRPLIDGLMASHLMVYGESAIIMFLERPLSSVQKTIPRSFKREILQFFTIDLCSVLKSVFIPPPLQNVHKVVGESNKLLDFKDEQFYWKSEKWNTKKKGENGYILDHFLGTRARTKQWSRGRPARRQSIGQ